MTTEVDPKISYAKGQTHPDVLDLTVGDLLRRATRDAPDRVAVLSTRDRRSWTYTELLRDCEAAAAGLLGRFSPGDRIAIWAQNVPEWVLAEFSLALAGLPIVTINPNLGADEAAYIINQSGAVAVLAAAEYRGRNLAAAAEEVQESCPNLREVLTIGSFGEIVEAGREATTALPNVDPGDLLMVQYTSGTTGFPKGAKLNHRSVVTNGYHTMMRNEITPGSVTLGVMPLFHTGGSVLAVLGSASINGTLALIEEFEPGHVLQVIEEYNVNVLSGVPTMLIALIEHPSYAERDLSSVAVTTAGGSTVPAALVEKLEEDIGAPFTIVFGQTELSPVCTMTRPGDTVEDKANTLGQPMPHVEIKVIDDEGTTVPHGAPGELCARGYLTMIGYNDDPTTTSETIDEQGWLHTGDLCTMDSRGYFTIAGRIKDMIIRGGENVYPREIEDVLFRHPSVGDVSVVGLPDDKWGEVVAAFIRPASSDTPSVEELQSYVRESLASHKVPVRWYQIEEFPLTGSGKVQKFRLIEQWTDAEVTPL